MERAATTGSRSGGLPYSVFRIAMGSPLLFSGIEKLAAMARGDTGLEDRLTAALSYDVVPDWAAGVTASVAPFIELAIGLSLVLGIYPKWGATAGMALLAGVAAIVEFADDSTRAAIQMVQLLVFLVGFYRVASDADRADPLLLLPGRRRAGPCDTG